MRIHLTALLTFTLLSVTSFNASVAQDWMFRRSWFSHLPAEGAPVFPTPPPEGAIRRAIPQLGPGFAVRSHYRWNVYRLQNGRSYDTTIYRQFSFEETP
jgi:hypothetical protein